MTTNFRGLPIVANNNATAISRIIDSVGAEGRVDQYLRELIVNGAQASASTVLVTAIRPRAAYRDSEITEIDENEFPALRPEQEEALGFKVAFVDDGDGMPREDLEAYMGQLFSGKSAVGRDKNFQIGSRVATLPISRYGVIIASWTAGDPLGSAVRLEWDEQQQVYTRRILDTEDMSSVASCDPDIFPELAALRHGMIEKAGHGTVVVLLGSRAEDNTFGQLRRGKKGEDGVVYPSKSPRNSLVTPILSKFVDLPGGLTTVSVVECRNAVEMSSWRVPVDMFLDEASAAELQVVDEAKGMKDLIFENRTVPGLRQVFADPSKVEFSGSVRLVDDDVEVAVVRWGVARMTAGPSGKRTSALYKMAGATDSGGLATSRLFGELHQGEVYNPLTATREANRMLGLYGIDNVDLCARMLLLVEPLSQDAVPDSARSRLVMGEYGQLPHSEWGDLFIRQMPDALSDLMNELSGEDADAKQAEKQNELGENIKSLFTREAPRFLGSSGSKAPVGDPAEGGGAADGSLSSGVESSRAGRGAPARLSRREAAAKKRAKEDSAASGEGDTSSRTEAEAEEVDNVVPHVVPVWDDQMSYFDEVSEKWLCRCSKVHSDEAMRVYINGQHAHLKAFLDSQLEGRNERYHDEMLKRMKSMIELQMYSRVVSLLMFASSSKSGVWGKSQEFLNATLSPESLSATLLDFATLQACASKAMKGRPGWGRKVA